MSSPPIQLSNEQAEGLLNSLPQEVLLQVSKRAIDRLAKKLYDNVVSDEMHAIRQSFREAFVAEAQRRLGIIEEPNSFWWNRKYVAKLPIEGPAKEALESLVQQAINDAVQEAVTQELERRSIEARVRDEAAGQVSAMVNKLVKEEINRRLLPLLSDGLAALRNRLTEER